MNLVAIRGEGRMSIENAVMRLPVTKWLDDNVALLIWNGEEGRGKIEYNDRKRLFTKIGLHDFYNEPWLIDFMPMIDAWMAEASSPTQDIPLSLAEAKQLRCEVVDALYKNKRIQPRQQGAYWYDASDEALSYMVALRTTGTTSEVNTLVTRINTNIINHFNTSTTVNIRAFQTQYNNAMGQLQTNGPTGLQIGTGENLVFARPGVTSAHNANYTFSDMTSIAAVAAGTGAAAIPWVPLNATAQVNIPFADFSAALDGILTRRRTLDGVKIAKKTAINAETTVSGVLAVDILLGW